MQFTEIERKWLMDSFPDLPATCEEEMEQAYLAMDPVAVRIRRVSKGGRSTFWLTLKGAGGLARTEVELPIEADQYAALLPLAGGCSATKLLRRYALGNGLELECSLVDAGTPWAFYYAEVEFESEAAARAFVAPGFLGREVTELPEYTMAAHCRRKAQGNSL